MADPSVPAVIEMVDVALKSYFLTSASEPKLSNPDKVHKAIRGLNVVKAAGPNGIPKRDLKHLPGERYLSWPRFSKRFYSPITSLPCGGMLG